MYNPGPRELIDCNLKVNEENIRYIKNQYSF